MKTRLSVLLFAFCAVLYLWHVSFYNYLSDDAFITMRYARNLSEGLGLVFNPGERVEGYTSTLWTLILALVHRVGLDVVSLSRGLGIVFGLVAMGLGYRLARLATGSPSSPLFAMLVPLVMAANGSFACWAASGMETMLYVMLVLAAFCAVFSGRILWAALCCMLLIVTRPESVLVAGTIGLYQLSLVRERGWKPFFVLLSACAVSFLGLIAFRFAYFGHLHPNTYYAKSGAPFAAVPRGIGYLRQYLGDHEGVMLFGIPLMCCLIWGSLRERALALASVLLWSAVVVAGGDGLPMYRFALAPLPLIAVLQASLLARAVATAGPATKSLGLAACAVTLLVGAHLTLPLAPPRYGLFKFQKEVEIPRWTAVGKFLKDAAPADASFACVPIGAVAFYSERTCLDMMGLTDAHIAHREMPNVGKGWAGHEKRDGQYILSRKPTYLLLGNIDVTKLPRDPKAKTFIPVYRNRAFWARESDVFDGERLKKNYAPKSFMIGPEAYLNCYELRADVTENETVTLPDSASPESP